jgi:sporulation protein YlmC with PRC-barrel domain
MVETPVETPVVGTPGAAEPGIPVTGMVGFVRVSELIGFDVEATGGTGVVNGTGTEVVQTPDPGVNQTETPGATDQTQTPETGTPAGQAGTVQDEGERVGSVSDVVVRVDNQENQMGDLVVSQDQVNVWLIVTIDEGFLGLGADTLVAVPLRNAQVDIDREVILLDFDPARIENAPTFTDDDWDDIVNPDWDAQFRGYWLEDGMGSSLAR